MEGLKHTRELIESGLTVENSVFGTLEETEKYAIEKKIRKLIHISDKITEKVLEVSENE